MIDLQYIYELEAEQDVMKVSDNYMKIKSLLQQSPQEQWSYEMILVYARALNFLQDYSDQTDPFEQAYVLLQTVADKGSSDADWHLIMASVSFNLQLYAEAVHHAEQANTIIAGCADDMLELYSQYD
ncbi:MAG: hypothetical protein K0Q94_4170 [Paenibacillus sp.]|jgi:hypothetical protein|uniref:hypothetical protein n=1 Tax=Paenibacillus sp. GCM10012303 TaxID=3317340 RepID=UPI0029E96AE0|nr:hypothetical protein [Paenibacillus sp.]